MVVKAVRRLLGLKKEGKIKVINDCNSNNGAYILRTSKLWQVGVVWMNK